MVLESILLEDTPYKFIHIAHKWKRYSDKPRFIGGILAVSPTLFRSLNGYPTFFEGWGGEDEAFLIRLETYLSSLMNPPPVDAYIKRPPEITVDYIRDLEGLDVLPDKLNIIQSERGLYNHSVHESIELDGYKQVSSKYGLNSDLYRIISTKTIQNQDRFKEYTVELNRNLTSLDIVRDNNQEMETPAFADVDQQSVSEQYANEESNMSININEEISEDEEEEPLTPININNDEIVSLDVDSTLDNITSTDIKVIKQD